MSKVSIQTDYVEVVSDCMNIFTLTGFFKEEAECQLLEELVCCIGDASGYIAVLRNSDS